MGELKKLLDHVRIRPSKLLKMKEEGVKMIGYTPGGYFPEELIYACDAMPIALLRGGDHEAVIAAAPYLGRFLDTFCRAQIGYRILGEPLYQMVDLVVAMVMDNHTRAISESWEMWTDVDLFKFAVPANKTIHGFEYYLDAMNRLKNKLETITGKKISEKRLQDEIALFNKVRNSLEEISLMRKAMCPPLSGKDFIMLNHASFFADRFYLVEVLESISRELREKEVLLPTRPRVMLIGSTLAVGDYKLIYLLENAGAEIVYEEFAEGIRRYSQKVNLDGDLMEALGYKYFMNRLPPAYAKPAIKERFDFYLAQAKEFGVDGAVWYSLMYRDTYDMEGFLFEKIAKKKGLPVLKINSDYDSMEMESLRTRIEAFIEMIKGGK
jgi:benzoyl-CoA reductase/2-hydroxyglutaryl-CoA dehydratase subunit BcrC/BadD/HgdB